MSKNVPCGMSSGESTMHVIGGDLVRIDPNDDTAIKKQLRVNLGCGHCNEAGRCSVRMMIIERSKKRIGAVISRV